MFTGAPLDVALPSFLLELERSQGANLARRLAAPAADVSGEFAEARAQNEKDKGWCSCTAAATPVLGATSMLARSLACEQAKCNQPTNKLLSSRAGAVRHH